MPTGIEATKQALDDFQKIQRHMLIAKEENAIKTYESLKDDYLTIKAFLQVSGVNITDIDKIKEQKKTGASLLFKWLAPYIQAGEYMEIRTNKELADAVNDAIKESGYKKIYIADQLGISRQALSHFINKSNFSIDDANKILEIIGYNAVAKVDKKYLQKVDKNS